MKRISLALLLLAGITAPLAHLHSQSAPTPAAAPAATPTLKAVAQVITISIVDKLKSPIEQLQAMKTANQALLDQQAKTLQALDELQKQAEELKTFGKRS